MELSVSLICNDPFELYIKIPHDPPRVNQLLGRSWQTNKREADKWRQIIWTATRPFIPEEPVKYCHLTFRRYAFGQLDYDNLVGGFKKVADGLKKACIIEDDRWALTGPWTVEQFRLPKGEETYIEIIIRERRATYDRL